MDTNTQKTDVKEVTLPSGSVAKIKSFKGRDLRAAQKIAGDDTSMVMFAIIAQTTTIDDKAVTAEELDDMDGMDLMDIMKHFGSSFTPRQSK